VADYDQWLDCCGQGVEPLRAILCPCLGDDFLAYPVSTLVDNPPSPASAVPDYSAEPFSTREADDAGH